MDIRELCIRQKKFFASGRTLDLRFRKEQIRKLRSIVEQEQDAISAALKDDLGKSEAESYMTEIGMFLSEASFTLKHLEQWAKPVRVKTPITQFPAKSYQLPSPYGNTLIISPWNYPFLLTMDPLMEALAAGNTAIVKTSPFSPAANRVVEDIISRCFSPEYVSIVQGDQLNSDGLLDEKFDFIFFTGSTAVGHIIAEKAARDLTPVTLELGGKSPCIVTRSADLPLAARRIVFGKFLNCGQTCVAPDYLLAEESIKEELVALIIREIEKQYGKEPLRNPAYGKIITPRHFERLLTLMEGQDIISGGSHDGKERLEPTLLTGDKDAAIMQQEIFGPLLPVFTFRELRDVYEAVEAHPTPLALYLFTRDDREKNEILSRISFGGGCVNDTIVHLATPYMGFGGVGSSGMGSYHGKTGFGTFSHYKSIMEQKGKLDLPLRYAPYSKDVLKIIKKFLR